MDLLYTKNGEILGHGSKVKIVCTTFDGKYNHRGIWEVRFSLIYGLGLTFIRLSDEEEDNQYPISGELSIRYKTIDIYFQKDKRYPVIKDTWGENRNSGKRWKQNDFSDDISLYMESN